MLDAILAAVERDWREVKAAQDEMVTQIELQGGDALVDDDVPCAIATDANFPNYLAFQPDRLTGARQRVAAVARAKASTVGCGGGKRGEQCKCKDGSLPVCTRVY